MNRINDSIYKIIDIDPVESAIIDTPIFQRLRDIKQLSMAYYVYPSSIHSRFNHSIGVMHLTNKIFTTLQKKEKKRKIKKYLKTYYQKNLRMAGLLHDIGHFPFSHTLDFLTDNKLPSDLPDYFTKKHVNLTTYIIRNSYIKNILKENKVYNIDLICDLIEGLPTDNFLLTNLINWELDADRFDYLLRDSHFTGVSFGVIDYNYLIENFEIYDEDDPYIVISEKAGRSIENILNARYSLYDRVYTHEKIEYYDYLLKYLVLQFFDELIPEFLRNESSFKDILANKESIEFFEFSDTYIMRKLYEKYKELKNKKDLSIDLEHAKLDLESLIFRKKMIKYLDILISLLKTNMIFQVG